MNGYFSWARDLGEAELGRALLALGLLPPSLGRSRALPSQEQLAELLLLRLARGSRVHEWRLADEVASLVRGPEEARRLEGAARTLLQRAAPAGGLRLAIVVPTGLDQRWLIRALLAGGAHTVEILHPPPEDESGDRSLGSRGSEYDYSDRGGYPWPLDKSPLDRSLDSSEPPEPVRSPRVEKPVRYLQARVEDRSGRIVEGPTPLLPGSDHSAAVFIGARAGHWLGLGSPIREPPPDPHGKPLALKVVFWEPRLCPLPQTRQLLLPSTGDSGVVRFHFRTAGPGILEAEVTVYYENRILQVGTLRGRVGDGPGELSFFLAAAPVPEFEELEERAPVDVSFLVNRDAEGRLMPVIGCRDQVATADPADPADRRVAIDFFGAVDDLNRALGRGLEPVAWSPNDFGDLRQEGTRKLLVELAQRGSALLRTLRKHAENVADFEDARNVQIVQKRVDDFFPAEFLYAGPPPRDDARICGGEDHAEEAIAAGLCCGAIDCGDQQTLCPLRFWSLSKVIERHAHVPEHSGLASRFELRRASVRGRTRTLDPLAGAILAANYRVDEEVQGTLAHLQARLAELVRSSEVETVEDWESWRRVVALKRPQLLVLLPHHGRSGNFDVLEIGRDQVHKSVSIEDEDVSFWSEPRLRPVVLLIGCDTANATVPIESFVTAFQDAGAAIVVSTIASVLGRHAGPATEVLVEEIHRIQDRKDATFGQAMLAARRRLLAQGAPMVLGLTSYGDADWRIARRP